jgi:hypothetical protein
MKSAMQELINELDLTKIADREKLIMVKYIIEQCLEKEKEQIQKAFSDGQETPLNHPNLTHYSRDEYYNDNYNQNK